MIVSFMVIIFINHHCSICVMSITFNSIFTLHSWSVDLEQIYVNLTNKKGHVLYLLEKRKFLQGYVGGAYNRFPFVTVYVKSSEKQNENSKWLIFLQQREGKRNVHIVQ